MVTEARRRRARFKPTQVNILTAAVLILILLCAVPATVSAIACGNVDGTEINDGSSCQCGTTDCTPATGMYCVPGQHNYTSTHTACLFCPIGYYTDQFTSPTCNACPKGFYGTTTGNSTCDACPVGTYNDQLASTTSTACMVCAPGSYQNASGSDECKLCPVGKTLTTAETAEFHDELKDCENCGILQFNPYEGHAEACYLCLTAKTLGSSQCDGCDPGKFKVTIVSSNGSTTNTCKRCESGYFSIKQNVKDCKKCPMGYFANHQVLAKATQARYDRCQACPRGTFGIATGANNASEGCSNCTSGTYSEVTGINNANLCKGCPQGKWRLLYFLFELQLLVSMFKSKMVCD